MINMIPRSMHRYIPAYLSFRFIGTFLSRLSRILSMRLHLGERSEREQQLLTERHQQNIRELTKKCAQVLTLLIIIVLY